MTIRFEEFKLLPPSEWKQHLTTLSRDELLKLTLEGAQRLNALIERIPEQIYDGMEKDLPGHRASARAAETALRRMREN